MRAGLVSKVAADIVDHNPRAVEVENATKYNSRQKRAGWSRAAYAIGGGMVGSIIRLVLIRLVLGVAALHVLVSIDVARAQAPSPDALAAAKELIETMHLNDQYKAVLPAIMKNLRAAIVQGRPEVDRQYDALVPVMTEAFQARVSEMSEAAAIVYARNFSADELHSLNEFYRTPAGQKLLQKFPAVAQELLSAGAKFGQSVGHDVQQLMTDELRKRGVNL
jgi:hypothetical protein